VYEDILVPTLETNAVGRSIKALRVEDNSVTVDHSGQGQGEQCLVKKRHDERKEMNVPARKKKRVVGRSERMPDHQDLQRQKGKCLRE
jgi:hypothetical protein